MRLAAGAFVATLLLVVCGCAGSGEPEARTPEITVPTYSFPGAPIVVDRPLGRRVDDALADEPSGGGRIL